MTESVSLRIAMDGDAAVLASLRRIGAEGTKALKDTADAAEKAGRSIREMDGPLGTLSAGFGSMATRALAAAAAFAAAYVSVSKFTEAADTFKGVINQLVAAGVEGDNLKTVFDQLYAVAQRNSAPIEGLAQLFGRVSQAQQQLGVSQKEIIDLTEIVGKSLRVSGQSAAQAQGALLQLAQALSSGKVEAEEFNSLLDGMYPLLRAAAAGLKEAGGDVAKLREMVREGEVSSKALFKAIEAGSGVLDTQLANAVDRPSQAMTRMNNEFIAAVAEFDRLTGASATLASALDGFSGLFMSIARGAAQLAKDIGWVIGQVQKLIDLARSMPTSSTPLNALGTENEMGLGALTDFGREDPAAIAARDRDLDPLQRARNALARGEGTKLGSGASAFGANVNAALSAGKKKPVSIKDHPVDDDEDEGGGRKAAAAKERINAYDREVESLRKRQAQIENEASLLGKSAFEAEKARVSFQLLAAAKEAGVPVTKELSADVEKLSTAYAAAKVAADEARAAVQAQNEMMKAIGGAVTSYLSDMISGGKNAERALMNLSKRMADMMLQAALMGEGPLGKMLGLQGSNGSMGGLLGLLFNGFRGLGGGASAAPALSPLDVPYLGQMAVGAMEIPRDGYAKLHAGEMVVPKFDSSLLRPLLRQGGPAPAAAAAPQVTIINQGSAQVEPEVQPDGSVLVRVMDAGNARAASQALRGRGAFADLIPNDTRAARRPG